MSVEPANMSIRNVPCPKCRVHMRRIYVQQGATDAQGRRNAFIPVGRGCLNCGHVEWDRGKGESIDQKVNP